MSCFIRFIPQNGGALTPQPRPPPEVRSPPRQCQSKYPDCRTSKRNFKTVSDTVLHPNVLGAVLRVALRSEPRTPNANQNGHARRHHLHWETVPDTVAGPVPSPLPMPRRNRRAGTATGLSDKRRVIGDETRHAGLKRSASPDFSRPTPPPCAQCPPDTPFRPISAPSSPSSHCQQMIYPNVRPMSAGHAIRVFGLLSGVKCPGGHENVRFGHKTDTRCGPKHADPQGRPHARQ